MHGHLDVRLEETFFLSGCMGECYGKLVVYAT